MTTTPADEITAFIREIRTKAQRIRSIDLHDTHAFVEDREEVVKMLERLERKFRVRFAGTPPRFHIGSVTSPSGRTVQVERRRSA